MAMNSPARSPLDPYTVRCARLAGALYLAIIALGAFGEMFVRGALVVSGDAGATAHNIQAAPVLWRIGIAGDVLMHVLDVPVIVFLYLLLKPVNPPLAVLATFFNVVQTAVLVLNKLTLLVPLWLVGSGSSLAGFSPEQLASLSYLAIRAHGHGFALGLIFFGMACLVRGYLIYRSTFLPRALGVLIFLAGASYLVNSVALLVAPALAAALFPAILLPAFVGELAFALWLLGRGVNLERWNMYLERRHAD